MRCNSLHDSVGQRRFPKSQATDRQSHARKNQPAVRKSKPTYEYFGLTEKWFDSGCNVALKVGAGVRSGDVAPCLKYSAASFQLPLIPSDRYSMEKAWVWGGELHAERIQWQISVYPLKCRKGLRAVLKRLPGSNYFSYIFFFAYRNYLFRYNNSLIISLSQIKH